MSKNTAEKIESNFCEIIVVEGLRLTERKKEVNGILIKKTTQKTFPT